ncbi:MAG: long-chain fatty acid--CoA ligase [Solirubrobacterales bacterium]|nr:long-chain fatty acid--CoA ligase [Solirubrobacterales bacterium]
MFVATLLHRAAVRWPDRVAVVDGERRIAYAELRERVARLANALAGLGLRPGDRVLDIQKNSHTYVESDLACAVAGLVRVPVNVRLTPAEWAYIAEDSGARAVICDADLAEAAAELAGVGDVELTVSVGGAVGRDYEALLADAAPALPHRWATPDELIGLNYSSGTTGKPKGCMRTAANRFASAQDMLAALFEQPLRPDDAWLHAGPLTHASGLFLLPHIAVGASQVLMRSFDAERVAAMLRDEAITGTVLVPTMLERVLAAMPEGPADAAALRRLAYAGAPMAADRIAAADEKLGGRLVQFYGLVEAIPPVTVLSQADHRDPELLTSAGRPAPGVATAVVGDDGEPVGPGERGELAIGGHHVMAGYWGRPEETVKSIESGWLRTGDVAWQDERGYVYLVDRKADMIITGGFNVMPREVELALTETGAVAEAAVIGVPDPSWGEAVTAYVVAAGDGPVDVDALMAHCAERLSAFKKPKRIEVVDSLPKASTGKISRAALRRQVAGTGR